MSFIAEALNGSQPDVILNATSFAVASGGTADPLAAFDCPVLQVVLAGAAEEAWQASSQGLNARDLAMNVVLPELDGRIMSRAISFKADSHWHDATQCRVVTYRAVPDRVGFVADLAANWVKLRRRPASARKVAIILANYPNKDGRIANGVGYDTPASTIRMLESMRDAGYGVTDLPASGNELIESLQQGTTNAARRGSGNPVLSLEDYAAFFAGLPDTVRSEITARWGMPEADPFFAEGHFQLPVRLYGNAAVAIQPARGYNIDPKSTYHDPALVPPHGYLAFYVWLRLAFGADAIIHNGKHGNLEWLPGKADCPVRRLLSGGRAWAAAAALSLHRQRSRRRNPGQAPDFGRHHRPPHATAHPRRDLWAAEGPRGAGRRILPGIRPRPPPPRRAEAGHPRPHAQQPPRPRCGLHRRRRGRPAAPRRLSLRSQGSADPRWPAHSGRISGRASCGRSSRRARPRAARPRRRSRPVLDPYPEHRLRLPGVRSPHLRHGKCVDRSQASSACRSLRRPLAQRRRHRRTSRRLTRCISCHRGSVPRRKNSSRGRSPFSIMSTPRCGHRSRPADRPRSTRC